METYTILRAFADSWMLLALTLFYIGAILWAFRPGSRHVHAEISAIPLREDRPLADPAPERGAAKTCTGACATCACAEIPDFLSEEVRHV